MKKLLLSLLLNITLLSSIYSQIASFCWKGEIYPYLAELVGVQSSSCTCEQTGVFLNNFPSCINGFELEFEETFDGNSLDLTKWQIQPWGQGALQGNRTMEYNSLDNITVSNGTCKIIAKKETVTRRAVNWKGDTEILSDGQQNLSVSSPESWPVKIRGKTLILNNQQDEKNKIYRVTDRDDPKATGIRNFC